MRNAIVTILVAIVFVGCKRPADSRMEKFSQTIRQTINPTELYLWAAKVISDAPRDHVFTELSTNGAPRGVQDLMTNYATLLVAMDGLSNDAMVIYSRAEDLDTGGFLSAHLRMLVA